MRVENSFSVPEGQGGQGRGGAGFESDRAGSTGTGGDSWQAQGQRLEWGAGVGGAQEAPGLELSGRGLWCDRIDSDCLSWFCVSVFHKGVFIVSGCVCAGALDTFLCSFQTQHELRTTLLVGGKRRWKQEPVGRLAGRGREVIRSRICSGISGTC